MGSPVAVVVATLALVAAGCSFGGTDPAQRSDARAGEDAPRTADAPGGTDGPHGADAPRGTDGPGVADARPPDARLPDAGFDPASCPGTYTVTIAAAPQSRYRWLLTNQPWATQSADCSDNLAGATHLAAFQSLTESQQLAGVAPTITYHVGASQDANQGSPSSGWYLITGEPLPAGLWQATQPNDNGGGENNAQNRADVYADIGPGLQDIDSAYGTNALCECDGHPVDPTVAGFP